MKSRQRVKNAIEHKSVDRMPYDFWAEETDLERLKILLPGIVLFQ